jgi:hypothetical protein
MPRRRINQADALRQVEQALSLGMSRAAAAAIAGIAPSTLWRWSEHSTATSQRLHSAEAQAEQHAVTAIAQAIGKGSWKAAIAFLERRFTSEWRLRTTIDATLAAPLIDVPSLMREHLVRRADLDSDSEISDE